MPDFSNIILEEMIPELGDKDTLNRGLEALQKKLHTLQTTLEDNVESKELSLKTNMISDPIGYKKILDFIKDTGDSFIQLKKEKKEEVPKMDNER